ncbi:hypothetical protein [Rhodococcus globerulus]|uniref:hypothetical protein n=1 Tax=Rhodococcus globerulus TaxID=33008 RepID=UPI001C5711D3|nr:hypothetical protein [Rhodococcus globerulus]QXW00697.1 hypothetical protein KYT97_20145 [Rhodococcus globerulus]
MNTSSSSSAVVRRKKVGLASVSAVSTLALVGGIVAGLAGPATAAPASAAAAFTAPMCEGTQTSADYPYADDMVIDGVRLDYYNAGNVVPLYYNNDQRSPAPICGVRDVPEASGPQSEWMYCTDMKEETCDEISPDGEPGYSDGGQFNVVGPTLPVGGNDRLTQEQELLISYLIQNPHPFTPGGVADDSTAANRVNRQLLIWCVSDKEYLEGTDAVVDCDADLGPAEQARILGVMNVTPALSISLTDPASGTLASGGKATFTVSTNMYGKPLTVSAPAGATLELCEPNANVKLTGNTLVVTGEGNDPTDVALCVTSPGAGAVKVSVSGAPSSFESIHWNNAGAECQVFATFNTVTPAKLQGDATVTFDAAPTTTPSTTVPTTTPGAPTTTPSTTVPTTTTKPNVIVPIIPIIPIIPVIPGVPVAPAPTTVAVPTPRVVTQTTPKAPTGERPTSIDGGAADETAGPHVGIAIAGLGLIGLAACGAIAVRRRRS